MPRTPTKGRGKKKKSKQGKQDDNPLASSLADIQDRSVGLDEIKLWSIGALRTFLEVRNKPFTTSTTQEELAAKYIL